MEKKSTTVGHRIYYLDFIRCFACLCVIMIHTVSRYIQQDFGSLNFWAGNILGCFSRVGVPLFVMISGALMLDENYSFSNKKLISHIKKMILFFVFWSAVYCIICEIADPVLLKHESLSIRHLIGCFVEGPAHLWFVYMIVGLYLILPLLRLWVKKENKTYVEYFIILSLIFAVLIPQIISVGSNYSSIFEKINDIFEKQLYLQYVGGFTVYFILGWYLHNFDFKYKTIIYILGIVGFLVSVFSTYILSVSTGKYTPMHGSLTINIFFQTAAVFLFVQTRYAERSPLYKMVGIVSKNSLGIYAVHLLIINMIYKALSFVGLNNAIITIPIMFIGSFVLSCAVSMVCRKIPVLKKLV